MNSSDESARNRATVAGHNACAASVAETDHAPSADHVEALERLVAAVGSGGRVLEVAPGSVSDAAWLEAKGVQVWRTDFPAGLIANQRDRGRVIAQFDVMTGELIGPWDGVVALYVIQHIGRELVDGVIGRIAAALRPGGTLLISFQEGEGERFSVEPEGTYQVVRWSEAEMRDCLARHELGVVWRARFEGHDGVWITVIAERLARR